MKKSRKETWVLVGSIIASAIAMFVILLTIAVIALVPERQNVKNSFEVSKQPTVQELFELTNTERIKAGLKPLRLDPQLNQAATAKCQDMWTRDYWDHNAPDGTEPWVFFEQSGYQYELAGENLASGYDTSQEVVVNWMNSPGHKENLLRSSYLDVGFGICGDGSEKNTLAGPIVVQHFGTPK